VLRLLLRYLLMSSVSDLLTVLVFVLAEFYVKVKKNTTRSRL
jgi:hypothetical protein